MERVGYPTPDRYIQTSFQQRLALREARAGILPAALLIPENRAEQYRKLESMIGNTPLMHLDVPEARSSILIKDESQNPTESHYDRVYVATLKRFEEDGVIKPGDELWEVTSGSAGISFAWAANRLGYRSKIFVPKRLPEGRKQEMRNFGAALEEVTDIVKVVDPITGEEKEVDKAYVPAASREQTRQFAALRRQGYTREPVKATDGVYETYVSKADGKPSVLLVNHSWNNITHTSLEAIGDEISAIIPRGVNIDYFISILGNGSSTRGASDALHRRFTGDRQLIPGDPRVFSKRMRVIGLEDETNPVWFVQKHPGKYEEMFGHEPNFETQEMFGGSAVGTDIKFVDLDMLDEVRIVTIADLESFQNEYNAGRQPGETIGKTSAASFVLALRMARENPGSMGLILNYDKGDRYGAPVQVLSQDYMTIPRQGWRQWVAEDPVVIPRDLRQAYQSREFVRMDNREYYRRAMKTS